MGCTITITSVQGFNIPGQQVPNTIRVNGTATDCEYVVVGLTCPEPPEEVVVPVAPNGTWTIDFVGNQVKGCRCQGDTLVYAYCKADPTCRVEKGVPSLPCQAVGECPEVTGLTATITGCAGYGKTATVTFTGTLMPPSTCTFEWNFGDNSPPVTTSTPAAAHVYTTPGNYMVTVNAICGNCVRASTIFIVIPHCCPTVTSISASGCADSDDPTAGVVTLTANLDLVNATGTYTWDFGDGQTAGPLNTNTVTHSYTSSGMKNVTVTFTPNDPDCPPSSLTSPITVDECPPPQDGGGEGGWCKALRYIMVIAAILALLVLLIAVCKPALWPILRWIALSLGIIAVLAGIIWAWLCPKPCGWGLLFAWQVGLGVGFAALYFTQCCQWLWWIGIGLIVAALAVMAAWVKQCKRTFCQTIVEVSVAIVGALLPILGWLGVIPALQACINSTVAAVLSTLAAGIAVALAACANNNNGP